MPNSAAQTNTSSSAHDAVFVPSAELPNAIPVRGFDFNAPPELDALLNAYLTTGFQGTSLALAVGEIKRMLEWRLSQEEVAADENEELKDEKVRKQVKCTIFLGYTSNLISSGLRESFRYLAEHKLVDCIVTTAGGAEEDLIKCLAPTFLLNLDSNNTSNDSKDAPRDSTNTTQPQTVAPDAWQTPGASLRRLGLNRIGNLVVPNSNYGMFEDWVMPILDGMLEEQKKEGKVWTPSLVMERLGREVGKLEKGRDSVAYWAWKVRFERSVCEEASGRNDEASEREKNENDELPSPGNWQRFSDPIFSLPGTTNLQAIRARTLFVISNQLRNTLLGSGCARAHRFSLDAPKLASDLLAIVGTTVDKYRILFVPRDWETDFRTWLGRRIARVDSDRGSWFPLTSISEIFRYSIEEGKASRSTVRMWTLCAALDGEREHLFPSFGSRRALPRSCRRFGLRERWKCDDLRGTGRLPSNGLVLGTMPPLVRPIFDIRLDYGFVFKEFDN